MCSIAISSLWKPSELPVRYEVNCFGPQRMGKRAVVLMFFCDSCVPSLGKKCVPLDDSPHQRSLTNVAGGGLWIVHNTRLIVTRRKHLSWPSTRGGRLVEGDTSLGTAKKYFWLQQSQDKCKHCKYWRQRSTYNGTSKRGVCCNKISCKSLCFFYIYEELYVICGSETHQLASFTCHFAGICHFVICWYLKIFLILLEEFQQYHPATNVQKV